MQVRGGVAFNFGEKMAHQEAVLKVGTETSLGVVTSVGHDKVIFSQTSGKNVEATLAEVETLLEKEDLK